MAEAVKVIVRCRPMNSREKGLKCNSVVTIDNRTGMCTIVNPAEKKAPPKSFTFDGAYDVNSTTEQIYADIGFPLVEGVTEGYNGTIFAYGQTGCGKSFSMQGIPDPASQRGIIPRAFDHIFETIQVSENAKYLVHASYLEIYNEEVRDLLGRDSKAKLELKEHPDRGVYVQGLSMHPCKDVENCNEVMDLGWKNRSTGATLMNADSSRSHSIFSIHLEKSEVGPDGSEHIKAAKLNLVDLAGSERQGKTGATGDRLKEATKINLSLSALGNVISALVDGKSTHIPYRDSKLTRLLQDSLGGNTKTLMVACLSPADNNYDETLSTLRYANRAKNIKNKPKINEDPKDAMLREYQEEIEKLKAMLRGEIPPDAGGSSNAGKISKDEMEMEKRRLREEFEREMSLLKQELQSTKASKEEAEMEINQLKEQYENQMVQIENGDNLNDSDGDSVRMNSAQQAVHLATHKRKKSPKDVVSTAEDAAKRLQELQQNFVGGEQANNEEVKERRKKNKKYSEEKRTKLQEALKTLDGDEIVAGIFKDVQDEVKFKTKLLEKEKNKSNSLQREIMDIQSEFEFDRIDYLDTIRKQDRQLRFMQALLARLQPLIRKDSNYSNLDKVRAQSEWDESAETWILPKVVVERDYLPPAGPNGNNSPSYANNNNNNRYSNQDDYDDLRYRQKLQNSETQQIAQNYFKNNRADELLSMNQRNGEVMDDNYIRKPARLEAIRSNQKIR